MTEEKKKFSLAVISISQILKKSTLKRKKIKENQKRRKEKNKNPSALSGSERERKKVCLSLGGKNDIRLVKRFRIFVDFN